MKPGRERHRLAMVLVLSLGMATVLMLGLPLLYLTLPDPGPVPVSDLEAAGRGVYLVADGETLRLFPRVDGVGALGELPNVHEVERVVIAVRQPGPASSYRLEDARGRRVPVDISFERHESGVRIRVSPESLVPGVYRFVMPRESMFGGEDVASFSVSR